MRVPWGCWLYRWESEALSTVLVGAAYPLTIVVYRELLHWGWRMKDKASLWKGVRCGIYTCLSTVALRIWGDKEMEDRSREWWDQGFHREGKWFWRTLIGTHCHDKRGEIPEKPGELRYQWGRRPLLPCLGRHLFYFMLPASTANQVPTRKIFCLNVMSSSWPLMISVKLLSSFPSCV